MKEKVSIIVPVYNAAPYLERCMASLLGQTYHNTEILLVDDGSTDGSGVLCDGFAAAYRNVKVFHMPNEGVSAARNRGLEECGGEYLTFVDADDVLEERALEVLIRMMKDENGDVAGCGYFEFCGDGDWNENRKENGEEKGIGKRIGKRTGKRTETRAAKKTEDAAGAADAERDGTRTEVLCGMEFAEHGILHSDTRCWSKLYRRESVGNLRFDTGLTIGEDMLFLLDLAIQGKTFVRSSYRGYGYFVNGNGAMLRGFQESYMDQTVCWQRALEKIGAQTGGKEDAACLVSRAESILVVSAMLVAGKLAALPGKARRKYKQYGEQCLALVKKYGKKPEVFRQLDRGYRIKVRVYGRVPGAYMVLYRLRCVRKRLAGNG